MRILSIKKFHKRQKLIGNLTAGNWSSAPPPPWIDLPRDVTVNILRRLDAMDILGSAQKVCSTWWRVCKEEPSIWRIIDMLVDSDDNDLETPQNLATMCSRAIDRSQRGLIDISVGDFATDSLLRYLSDRSSRLKRLRIASCGISGRCLIAAVKKMPELEELHLFYTPTITAEDIEDIGIFCLRLKSFAFNNRCSRYGVLSRKEDYALAIGNNMPKLRKLEFSGLAFSEQGLQAILDGCPWLESLDLQQSCYDGSKEDLDTRCSRIKDLKRPSDSTWIDCFEDRNVVPDFQKFWYVVAPIGPNEKGILELPRPPFSPIFTKIDRSRPSKKPKDGSSTSSSTLETRLLEHNIVE